MGLTLAFEGEPICGGGMSTKSFLSSLMAVSTRAWSDLDSLTYPRREAAADLKAARDIPLRGAAAVTTPDEPEVMRAADLNAADAKLAMVVVMVEGGKRWRCCLVGCDYILEELAA
jgi:hypothetical protein